MIRYDSDSHRLWILKARIHHGAVGALLLLVGLALVIDDWNDIPWIRDNL